MIEVTLTPNELHFAAMVGLRRRTISLKRDYAERNGMAVRTVAEAWWHNIKGAIGELAAAKALGRYWSPVCDGNGEMPDIGQDIQVRCLEKHHYDLIIRPGDQDAHRYVLVTGGGVLGEEHRYKVHGWIVGADAKRPEWLCDKSKRNVPAYFVPQKSLRPVEELK